MPGIKSHVDKMRYGFNGMENDNEIKGDGNSVDFGARMYDPRLGRWQALDPLAAKYPSMSPYNFVGNMPIVAVDPNGKEIIIVVKQRVDYKEKMVEYTYRDGKVYKKNGEALTKIDHKHLKRISSTLNNLQNKIGGEAKGLIDKLQEVGRYEITVDVNKANQLNKKNTSSFGTGTANVPMVGGENHSLTQFQPDVNRQESESIVTKTSSDETILGHELKHAYNRIENEHQEVNENDDKVSESEVDAVNFGNYIREKQNKLNIDKKGYTKQEQRKEYDGKTIEKERLVAPSEYSR